jgi:hypothetical protein
MGSRSSVLTRLKLVVEIGVHYSGEPVERPTYEESKEISLVLCQTELTCKIEEFEDLR